MLNTFRIPLLREVIDLILPRTRNSVSRDLLSTLETLRLAEVSYLGGTALLKGIKFTISLHLTNALLPYLFLMVLL